MQKGCGGVRGNLQVGLIDEHGVITWLWLAPWLKENMRAQSVSRGSLMAVTFLGKKLAPSGRTYNAYEISVQQAGKEPLLALPWDPVE